MLLDQAALCKQAAMAESMELKEMKFHPTFMSELEKLLVDVYVSLLPSSSEYEQRKQLVQAYNMTAKTIFGDIGGFPAVEAFGSFTMNIFTAKSDLDLSINFDNSNAKCLPRDQVVSILRRFAKVLRRKQSKGHLSGVLPILGAKVPVLKAVDCKTEQTRDPPILPPFSTLLRDGMDPTNLHQVVPEFMNLAKRNKESVAELFVSLLAKLTSVETLWELGLCASNFEGSWISKTWTSKKYSSNMNVEDFMDRDQNFARSVGKFEMPKIYDCLRGSLRYLSSSMQGQIETSALGTLLFGSISLHTQTNPKLPIKSIHPHANVIGESSRALKQKQTSNDSVQKLPIEHIQTRVHTNTTTILKRKEKSTKSAPPLASAIAPADQATVNAGSTLKTKPPPVETTESKPPVRTHVTNGPPKRRTHVTNSPPKRPRNDKPARELPPGYLQNPNRINFPSPMMHPALSYYLPPLNGIGHLNAYAHQTPPLHRLAPHHRPVPQRPPMAPESSRMFQYYSNPVHPMILDGRHDPSMFPGYTSNAGYPQFLFPQRSFGSNHP